MDRRSFLRRAIVVAGGTAMLPTAAMASPRQPVDQRAPGPYGSLEDRPIDANGLVLPEGFTSRIVAVSGEPVADTGYVWPVYPDGAGTFDDGEGGWRYVCNSEVRTRGFGGVSAVHFGPDGEILDATSILDGTTANCSGGPTPWGTWLSCEEPLDGSGQVYECDPAGEREAMLLPALGRWDHEAAAVDPEDRRVYLTQDHRGGLLYRFTPDAYPALRSGLLEAASVDDGDVTWLEIPDPSGSSAPTRTQAPGATIFPGNEGIWYHDGTIVFTSKFDNRVHRIDLRSQRHEVLWDGTDEAAVLAGVPPREPSTRSTT